MSFVLSRRSSECQMQYLHHLADDVLSIYLRGSLRESPYHATFAEMEFAQKAVSSASGHGPRVSVDLPFSASVNPCFPMRMFALISRSCPVLDLRLNRIRCAGAQNSESALFPSSTTPHSRQHLALAFRATLIPSLHSTEHHSPGSSFRVQ